VIEEILSRLEGVKKRGKGYIAKCSAHPDKNPSLSLSELPDGRILIKCFAGCSPQDILASMGLSMSDLFPDNGLGYYKSFQRLNEEYQAKIENHLSVDEIVLKIAELDRESGKRLSKSDLEKERQAFERIKNATPRR
jgi:putative DNA primase/helicase